MTELEVTRQAGHTFYAIDPVGNRERLFRILHPRDGDEVLELTRERGHGPRDEGGYLRVRVRRADGAVRRIKASPVRS